jgi:hypothetical protein
MYRARDECPPRWILIRATRMLGPPARMPPGPGGPGLALGVVEVRRAGMVLDLKNT